MAISSWTDPPSVENIEEFNSFLREFYNHVYYLGTDTSGTLALGENVITSDIAGDLLPSLDGTWNIGSALFGWKDLYLTGSLYFDDDYIFTHDGTNFTLNDTLSITGDLIASGDLTAVNLVLSGDISVADITAVDLTLTGDLTTSLTENSVPYIGADGILTEDSLLKWYTTENSLQVGDSSIEQASISVNGSTYTTGLRTNDLDNSHVVQIIHHKHSTTLPPVMLGARSNSDTVGHLAVTNGQELFSIAGSGIHTDANPDYSIFSAIVLAADSSGTINGTSAPGAIYLKTVADGDATLTLTTALSVLNDQTTQFENTSTWTDGNLVIPATTATSGIIYSASNTLLHTFPIGSFNVFVGEAAGNLTMSGTLNMGMGAASLLSNVGGTSNMAIGANALNGNTSGNSNIAIGTASLFTNSTGDNNLAIGASAGQLVTGSNNVFLGYSAGKNQGATSSMFLLDNQDRGASATELTNALMYGVFNAAPASQTIRINAVGTIPYTWTWTGGGTIHNDLIPSYWGTGSDASLVWSVADIILSMTVNNGLTGQKVTIVIDGVSTDFTIDPAPTGNEWAVGADVEASVINLAAVLDAHASLSATINPITGSSIFIYPEANVIITSVASDVGGLGVTNANEVLYGSGDWLFGNGQNLLNINKTNKNVSIGKVSDNADFLLDLYAANYSRGANFVLNILDSSGIAYYAFQAALTITDLTATNARFIAQSGNISFTGGGSPRRLAGTENIIGVNSGATTTFGGLNLIEGSHVKINKATDEDTTVTNVIAFNSAVGSNSGTGDFTITNLIGFKAGTFPAFTGTQTNVAGVWVDPQTAGTNNYGIVLDGNITAASATALGSAIVFGAGQDAMIGFDGSDLWIDPDVQGNNTGLKIGSATTDYVHIEDDADINFVGGAGLQFGEIYGHDRNITVTISAGTGDSEANKLQITGSSGAYTIFDTDGESNAGCTPAHAEGHITVTNAGRYLIVVSMAIEGAAGAGDEFSFHCYYNNGGTKLSNLHAHRDMSGGGGDTGSLSMSGIVDLPASATVEIWFWNDTGTSNIIIDDVTLSLVQVGGTT